MSLIKFLDHERFIHSIKTAIACLVGYLLTKFVGFYADQWIVITILIVMCAQIYVGSVLQRALLRFIGTFLGCLISLLAIFIAGTSDIVIISTLLLTSCFFSYLSTSSENLTYAGTLGAATVAIILLNAQPTIHIALTRFLDISTGILIAALISQFVLPIHARTHLRRTQAKTLEQLRDYYKACIVTHNADINELFYQEFEENIVKFLSKQRQLTKEAGRELLGAEFNPKIVVQILQCEKEILRSINFMHNALVHLQQLNPEFSKILAFQEFNTDALNVLNALIKTLEPKKITEINCTIPKLTMLKQEVQKYADKATREQLIYIDGFIFSAEVLTNCLEKLCTICKVTYLA